MAMLKVLLNQSKTCTNWIIEKFVLGAPSLDSRHIDYQVFYTVAFSLLAFYVDGP